MNCKILFPKFPFLLILAFSFFLAPAFSFGANSCVSNPTELQTALTTAASNGEDDTIQIVQGTYSGNFTYASYEANSLTVEGGYTSGCASQVIAPANTVLDGGGTDTVLALVSQGAANFSVEGLTLQNGNTSTADDGGGLHARTDGVVTLTNNTFSQNTAEDEGGGVDVFCYNYPCNVTATLTDNIFTGNTAGAGGGGFHVYSPDGGTTTLTNNRFTENTAGGGGGVLIISTNSTLTNNTFTTNTGGCCGGAVVSASNNILTNNIFTGNTATTGKAGGASVGNNSSTGTTTFTNNTFSENTAEDDGSGVYINSGNIKLTNNTFRDNTTYGSGGGVYISPPGSFHASPATLTNNTFSQNTAEDGGCCCRFDQSGSGTAKNCSGAKVNDCRTVKKIGCG